MSNGMKLFHFNMICKNKKASCDNVGMLKALLYRHSQTLQNSSDFFSSHCGKAVLKVCINNSEVLQWFDLFDILENDFSFFIVLILRDDGAMNRTIIY